MSMVPLYGHRSLASRLLTRIMSGTLPHSLLLHGESGIGKQRLALWLASALLCEQTERPCGHCKQCRMAESLTHPDITWIFPRPRLKDSDPSPDDVKGDLIEGALERAEAQGLYAKPSGSEGIYVPTIRYVVRLAGLSPALARAQVIVVGDAERMVSQEGADQAANAFLKLLEEPPSSTYLILTSSRPGALLPTIRSRVVAARVAPLAPADVAAFVDHPTVRDALGKTALPSTTSERVALAAGAPGRLLGAAVSASLKDRARELVGAAVTGDQARLISLALAQGSAGARGAFSDLLDATQRELYERLKRASTNGDLATARAAAKAVESVEDSKTMAQGNVNPQLITWSLLHELREAFATVQPSSKSRT